MELLLALVLVGLGLAVCELALRVFKLEREVDKLEDK